MTHARLTINLGAVVRNWQRLDGLTSPDCETAATVKADAYGLGVKEVASALAQAGCRTFFVAMPGEALQLRKALGDGPVIGLLSGCMPGDEELIAAARICPILLSPEQYTRFAERLPDHPYGLQIDTGMNRVGIAPGDFGSMRDSGLARNLQMVISHLGDADRVDSDMNAEQLGTFRAATRGMDGPRSLAATGGMLLGPDFHFDLCRPGIGLYGGDPYTDAEPTLTLAMPIVQVHDVEAGSAVGYGGEWVAPARTRVATVLGGYSDGIPRHLNGQLSLYANRTGCPVLGRLSMDLMTVDVSALGAIPSHLELLNGHQTVNHLARAAGTLPNEVLSGLSQRYDRVYVTC